jgi:hypothetical protein
LLVGWSAFGKWLNVDPKVWVVDIDLVDRRFRRFYWGVPGSDQPLRDV